MRIQDWGFLVAGGGLVLAAAATMLGHPLSALALALAAVGAAMIARRASLRHPAPMSPALRWVLHLPRGPHSPQSLLRALAPRPGERILEVGSGDGVHALTVARALNPDGSLQTVDIERRMLEDLAHRARNAGLSNVRQVLADGQDLPYPDDTFDGAFLVTVLGEIPSPDTALRELRRVLKRDGRLVVGEMCLDPDFVSLTKLVAQARAAGFTLERRWGSKLAYLARFVVPRPSITLAPRACSAWPNSLQANVSDLGHHC